jgi:virulence factor Mce-like protein
MQGRRSVGSTAASLIASRRIAVGALVAAAIALGVVLLSNTSSSHQLRAVFTSALQVFPGQQVRIAGRTVGSVGSVGLDGGLAVVGLNVDPGSWPLHQGTTAELRFGSAAGYAARFVELHPGPASAPALPQDGVLAVAQTTAPVEFTQVFDTFSAPTRRALGGTLENTAAVLSGHTGDLAHALAHAGSLESFAGVQQDLGSDPHALSALVENASSVADALATRDGELPSLADSAATTFAALAANAGAQQQVLDRLPATLRTARGTLGHLDRSLTGLSALVAELKPGAVGLRQVAPVLRTTLVTLRRVAPRATETLRTGTATVPALSRFLSTGTRFLPGATRALTALNPMLACVRPYTPEIAGFASTWDGFTENFDGAGHYARILVQESPLIPGTKLNSVEATSLPTGGLQYAMPRPPGLNVGQPWFLPQCGAGPDSLNPKDDPENGG